MNLAYYYCSLPTFLNIIRNRSIYLSNPLVMNDSKEIKWFFEALLKPVTDYDFKYDFDSSFASTLIEKGQDGIFCICM